MVDVNKPVLKHLSFKNETIVVGMLVAYTLFIAFFAYIHISRHENYKKNIISRKLKKIRTYCNTLLGVPSLYAL